MRSPVVIVVHIGSQNTAHMPLVQYDHMIEHVAPDTADHPLAIGILPRRWGRNLHPFNARVMDSVLERGAVDGIPVPQQVTRWGVPRKRLDDLLRRPLC